MDADDDRRAQHSTDLVDGRQHREERSLPSIQLIGNFGTRTNHPCPDKSRNDRRHSSLSALSSTTAISAANKMVSTGSYGRIILSVTLSCALVLPWVSTDAFSVTTSTSRHVNRVGATCINMATGNDNEVSRRTFFNGAVTAAASAMFVTALPQVAYADVTNKVASTTALRNVKRAQRQLTKILPYVEMDDYEPIKETFRQAPFSDIRKNMSILIKGAEDGPLAETLQKDYDTFKSSVEKLDSTSGQALRGRKIPNEQLVQEYQAAESALAVFVKDAEEAVEIPLQGDGETAQEAS